MNNWIKIYPISLAKFILDPRLYISVNHKNYIKYVRSVVISKKLKNEFNTKSERSN